MSNYTKPYVEADERAEQLRSSFFAFMIMDIIILVVSILIYIDIIPIAVGSMTTKIFDLSVLALLFLIFLGISVGSFIKINNIKKDAAKEINLTEEIIEYTVKNFNDPVNEETPEEEKYFLREEALKALITSEFKGLDDSYLEFVLETVYEELFPNS